MRLLILALVVSGCGAYGVPVAGERTGAQCDRSAACSVDGESVLACVDGTWAAERECSAPAKCAVSARTGKYVCAVVLP